MITSSIACRRTSARACSRRRWRPRAAKRDRAYLVVLAGASVGEMYKVEGDKTIIGRGQKAQSG